jgi:hypothetical protein
MMPSFGMCPPTHRPNSGTWTIRHRLLVGVSLIFDFYIKVFALGVTSVDHPTTRFHMKAAQDPFVLCSLALQCTIAKL